MDYSGVQAIHELAARNDWLEDPIGVFSQLSEVIFIALLAVLFLVRGNWSTSQLRHAAVAAGLAAAVGLAVAHGVTMIWDRPRPFEAHPGLHPFVAHAGDASFPSDHTTAAFAIAVAILLRNRRLGLIVFGVATAVGLSRLIVGVHYPSDVLGGAILGSAAALVLWIEPVRSAIERVADALGSAYERIAARALGAARA